MNKKIKEYLLIKEAIKEISYALFNPFDKNIEVFSFAVNIFCLLNFGVALMVFNMSDIIPVTLLFLLILPIARFIINVKYYYFFLKHYDDLNLEFNLKEYFKILEKYDKDFLAINKRFHFLFLGNFKLIYYIIFKYFSMKHNRSIPIFQRPYKVIYQTFLYEFYENIKRNPLNIDYFKLGYKIVNIHRHISFLDDKYDAEFFKEHSIILDKIQDIDLHKEKEVSSLLSLFKKKEKDIIMYTKGRMVT